MQRSERRNEIFIVYRCVRLMCNKGGHNETSQGLDSAERERASCRDILLLLIKRYD